MNTLEKLDALRDELKATGIKEDMAVASLIGIIAAAHDAGNSDLIDLVRHTHIFVVAKTQSN